MKKNQIFFPFLLLIILFCSCEKGSEIIDVEDTIYIPQSGYSTQTALLGESDFALSIYKAGHQKKENDVTVSVSTGEKSYIDEFIAANPEYNDYSILPDNFYSIQQNEVVIKGKEESSDFTIRIKGIDESFVDSKYLLPIAIQKVSSGKINEEKSVAILHFSHYRNVYEGLHRAYGWVSNNVNSNKYKVDQNKTLTSYKSNGVTTTIASESTAKMILTIDNNNVTITSAPGYEEYKVKNTSIPSTYEGTFDKEYQRNKGTYKLNYSFEAEGEIRTVEEEIKFWL